jgi:hypothetical protein
LHYSHAAITEKGGRRRREEGSLLGIERAGGLTGGPTVRLEVVRPAAGCGCNWKKKK